MSSLKGPVSEIGPSEWEGGSSEPEREEIKNWTGFFESSKSIAVEEKSYRKKEEKKERAPLWSDIA